MQKLKVAILSLFLAVIFIPQSTFAGEAEADALMSMIQGLKIDKKQVGGMLDMMAAQGQITKKQAEDAKKQLANMSDSDMQKLQKKAVEKAKAGAGGVGLNQEHQKMVEEMKKRMNAGKTN